MIDRTRHHPDEPEIAALRSRLEGLTGPQYWRSLEELAATPEFEHYLHREFPEQASEWLDPVGRRRFLQLMGASISLAGISGCVFQPEEAIVPYVRAPEHIVPGRPLFFATAAVHDGFGLGVLAESHMGRPTKLEGNPDHPASLGATDAITQASVLTLYDPDRSQVVTQNGRVSTFDNFLNRLIGLRTELLASKGARLRLLSGSFTSPTLARLMSALFAPELFPDARWHFHDPVGHESSRLGSQRAFGRELATLQHLDKADVVVALDADLFGWGPQKLVHARAWADRREAAASDPTAANRLYVLEPCPTVTGAAADHRLPLPASQIAAFTLALAHALGIQGLPPAPSGSFEALSAIADDLKAHRGRSLVVAGEAQPPEVHALVHAINQSLGNVGQTVTYHEPILVRPAADRAGTLGELVNDMNAGAVDVLVILGANPVYDAPADLRFRDAYQNVPHRIHLGLYLDETAAVSTWHIPEAHPLEAWGDVRSFDGTPTIIQPLIAPLYNGRTAIELISALVEGNPRTPRDLVQETWRSGRESTFDAFWTDALVRGVAGEPAPAVAAELRPLNDLSIPAQSDGLELSLRPDPSVWDGHLANNGWLQELPRPITKLVWDNALQLSVATAARLGLKTGDLVELTANGQTLPRVAILPVPGHADDALTLTLGYGRTEAGRVGTGVGFNAYLVRTTDAPWVVSGVTLRPLGERYELATTQMHFNIPNPNVEAERRGLIRVATLDQFARDPHFASGDHGSPGHGDDQHDAADHNGADHPDESAFRRTRTKGKLGGHHPDDRLILFEYPEPMARRNNGEGNAWGMSINLNTCIGCNACIVACQAENNIPIVGKREVLRGREMHWLRIDRYYASRPGTSPTANPKIHFQPVLCMHCETAPCEVVCPVAATTHSAEGLNEMTYNRCVGTRYCSNNCPYKVRRFNFFTYADHETTSLKLQRNPDVSVRVRGVMEKCTYCVQRISAARIASEIAGEPRVPGNAVVTACQQVCPTRAIVFGNLNDPSADVVRLKADPRDYGLLTELNTRPRTTYLAKLTNPNPAIEA
ncbi:MAG: molybdopterin oxidoreductase [Isosphaeraceae bacterium]|jgi:molybdopterin-containing oxidoreductase family iron-sulfur binding subunit|nr:MAG: molybdopterin oxidoreductase [Isosphaeraceae bacterium]